MKKLLLTLVIAASAIASTFAGNIYTPFSIGYRQGYVYMGNLNRTIWTYNFTRQWLTQKMDYITAFRGVDMTWSITGRKMSFDFGLAKFGGRHHAFGPEPNTGGHIGNRIIKAGMTSFSAGLSGFLKNKEYYDLKIGTTFDIDAFVFKTWYYDKSSKESPDGARELHYGTTFYLQSDIFPNGKGVGISLKPYYQVFFHPVDARPIASTLQGANYVYPMEDNPSHFGFSLLLTFAKNR